jgi:hypothetical protein
MNTIKSSQELLQIVAQVDLIEGCPILTDMELLSALSKCGVNWLTIDSLDRILTEMEHQHSLQCWQAQQQKLMLQSETPPKVTHRSDDGSALQKDQAAKLSARRKVSLAGRSKSICVAGPHRLSVLHAPAIKEPGSQTNAVEHHSSAHDASSNAAAPVAAPIAAQRTPPSLLPPAKDRFPMERAAFLSLLLELRGREDGRARHAAAAMHAPGGRRSATANLQALRGRLESERLELVNAVEPQLQAAAAVNRQRATTTTNSSNTSTHVQASVAEQVVRLLSPFSISRAVLDEFLQSGENRPQGKASLMQLASWLVQEESKAEVVNTSERSKAAKARWRMAIDAVRESVRSAKKGMLLNSFQSQSFNLVRRGLVGPEERLAKAMQDAQHILDSLRSTVPVTLEFPYSKQIAAYGPRQLHSSTVDEMLHNLCRTSPSSRVASLGKVLTTMRRIRGAVSPGAVRLAGDESRVSHGVAGRVGNLSPIQTSSNRADDGSHRRPGTAPPLGHRSRALTTHPRDSHRSLPSMPRSPETPGGIPLMKEQQLDADNSTEPPLARSPAESQLAFWTQGNQARPQSTRGTRLLQKFDDNFDKAKLKKQQDDERDEALWRHVLQASAEGRPRSGKSSSVLLAARHSPVVVRVRI